MQAQYIKECISIMNELLSAQLSPYIINTVSNMLVLEGSEKKIISTAYMQKCTRKIKEFIQDKTYNSNDFSDVLTIFSAALAPDSLYSDSLSSASNANQNKSIQEQIQELVIACELQHLQNLGALKVALKSIFEANPNHVEIIMRNPSIAINSICNTNEPERIKDSLLDGIGSLQQLSGSGLAYRKPPTNKIKEILQKKHRTTGINNSQGHSLK